MDDYTRPTATIDVEASLELTASDKSGSGTPWAIVIRLSRPLTDKEVNSANAVARQVNVQYLVQRDAIVMRGVDFADFQRNGRKDVDFFLDAVDKAGRAERLAEQMHEATLQQRRQQLLALADTFNPKD